MTPANLDDVGHGWETQEQSIKKFVGIPLLHAVVGQARLVALLGQERVPCHDSSFLATTTIASKNVFLSFQWS